MNVTLNGQQRELGHGWSIAELLDDLNLEPVRVAVEVNRQLVSRGDFGLTTLDDGDVVEVVTLVGGG
ncbi:MAG: sulfur carrier protein ThiS [Planctomycetes bacterium]|nr:sulfur carrier protein ThiS [Planctomycetota bacterium]